MMDKWRVGKTVPINVYEGDRPVCQCHTSIDARRIVHAMNVITAIEVKSLFAPRPEIENEDTIR